jgi:Ca2+-binding EF-hand superfamily protein
LVEEVKELMNIESYDISTLTKFLMEQASGSGYLTRDGFYRCFSVLIDRNGEGRLRSSHEKVRARQLLNYLFELFDSDSNGVVDISELSAGISILCGGSREQKVTNNCIGPEAPFHNYCSTYVT